MESGKSAQRSLGVGMALTFQCTGAEAEEGPSLLGLSQLRKPFGKRTGSQRCSPVIVAERCAADHEGFLQERRSLRGSTSLKQDLSQKRDRPDDGRITIVAALILKIESLFHDGLRSCQIATLPFDLGEIRHADNDIGMIGA